MVNNQCPRELNEIELENTKRTCEKIVKELWDLDEYSLSDVCGGQHEKYQQGIHAMADMLMCVIDNVWVNKTDGKHPKQINTEDLRRILLHIENRLAFSAGLRGASETELRTWVLRACFRGGGND